MKLHNTEINLHGMELSKSDHTPATKKYEEANDQHIRKIVVYADTNKKLFIDVAKTKKLSAEEAERQFYNGLVIDTGTGVVLPTGCSVASGVASLTIGNDTYTASAE